MCLCSILKAKNSLVIEKMKRLRLVKKLIIGVAVILLFLIGGFLWLLSQASPESAPQDIVTIELPDTYEK